MKRKGLIGKFPISSIPHHITCKATKEDGWHLPLLFYSHVNLPWCGAGFCTNTDALSLQFFCILTFFSSKCSPASCERMIAILILSSHLLPCFTPFPFLFSPLFLYSCREISFLSCSCQGGSSLSRLSDLPTNSYEEHVLQVSEN